MPAIPRLKLDRFFRLFAPEYVLGTTYSVSLAFFESSVFPCINRSKLRKCLIVCDRLGFRRATSEATALRSASREYMAAVAPTTSRFHSKVWMLIGEDRLAILVGSGNLTQSGFIDNVELFEILDLTKGGPGRQIAESAGRFVNGLRSLWQDTSLIAVDTLAEMGSSLSAFAKQLSDNSNGEVRFLTSFDGPLSQQFRDVGLNGKLYIASPYFGGSVAGVEALQQELSPSETIVFPAVHSDGTLDVPLEALKKIAKPRTLALGAKKGKFAHLKMYGFQNSGNEHWLFTGSANCTLAALQAENVEAGVLRKVSGIVLKSYFLPMKRSDFPQEQKGKQQESTTGWLAFYAGDLGDVIELVVEPHAAPRLPLRDVDLEISCGGQRFSNQRELLFERGRTARIPWRSFLDGQRLPQAARVLHLKAIDTLGQAVSGAAFVDDLAALSAEPAHRSAWRAALALLSSEAVPEYADFAALLTLAEDIAANEGDSDEESPSPPLPATSRSSSPAGSTDVAIKDKAAVWPPRPIEADTSMLTGGRHSQGQLYWFNRILAALVRKPANRTETSGSAGVSDREADDPGDNGEDTPEFPEPALLRACDRMLNRAFDAFSKLKDRLRRLEITKQHARKIWGPSTYVLLGALGVRNAVERLAADELDIPSPTALIRDWLGALFSDRIQDADYTPAAADRHQHEVFPPVAQDLSRQFQIHPHYEICSIALVAFAHVHALESLQRQHDFHLAQWLVFRTAAGDNLDLAWKDQEHLEHLWRRYLDQAESALTWTTIARSLAALDQLSWNDHPGFKDLLWLWKECADKASTKPKNPELVKHAELWRQRGSRVELVTDRFNESCLKSNCPRYGCINPQFRVLQNLQPVICGACGCALIPVEIYEQFLRR